MLDTDAYDEAKEGFGPPVITDQLVEHLRAELDNAEPNTYTNKVISNDAPAKKETKVAEPKTKIDNSKIRDLDPRIIKVEEGFNARDFATPANQEHVKNLAASIKNVGVLESLTVRYDSKSGEYYLVNGESRLRATLQAIKDGAPIKTVPVNFERKGTTTEQRIATLITRNEGKSLNVLEQSIVFERLSNLGWKIKEIQEATGKTGPFIGAAIKLAQAPVKLKELIAQEKVSPSFAIDVLRGHEFDYEKAYSDISDGVATAAALGKSKATAATTKTKKKGESKTPLHFQRSIVSVFIDVLAEIAADTSLQRGTRNKAKSALENADIDAKEWLKQAVAEDDEE